LHGRGSITRAGRAASNAPKTASAAQPVRATRPIATFERRALLQMRARVRDLDDVLHEVVELLGPFLHVDELVRGLRFDVPEPRSDPGVVGPDVPVHLHALLGLLVGPYRAAPPLGDADVLLVRH